MNANDHRAILIADLFYGDSGKGGIVDYLARLTQAKTVVRYNGGGQAAHNVTAPDGRHHTFAQFGSGTLVPGTRTHLSRFMILHPPAMLAEERHLRSLGILDAFERLTIEREALVTTPFQQAANRIKEIARGGARHGSCGMGVGETMSDWIDHGDEMLFAGDLAHWGTVVKKLKRVREIKLAQVTKFLGDAPRNKQVAEELKVFYDPSLIEATAELYSHFANTVSLVDADYLGDVLKAPGVTIFEGAQGVLLDEWYGFFPYTTWSTLTFKNADTLLSENKYAGKLFKLGLARGYATRHGAGPLVTEDAGLTKALQDHHNVKNPWQREFRVGHLDLVALRYALNVTGQVDGLALTNLDRMDALPAWRVSDRYRSSTDRALLEKHFDLDGDRIRDIKVPADLTNLERQGELTDLLGGMQPVLQDYERDRETYVNAIARALDLPLAMTSFGPTALEKRIRGPLADFLRSPTPPRRRRKSSGKARRRKAAPLAAR